MILSYDQISVLNGIQLDLKLFLMAREIKREKKILDYLSHPYTLTYRTRYS